MVAGQKGCAGDGAARWCLVCWSGKSMSGKCDGSRCHTIPKARTATLDFGHGDARRHSLAGGSGSGSEAGYVSIVLFLCRLASVVEASQHSNTTSAKSCAERIRAGATRVS
jgi:hypothetical protein